MLALRHPWRLFGVITVPLTIFALSACGGGGAGSPVPAAPTPAPNPTAAGSAFAYTGTLTQTITLSGTPAPSPDPTSTPWVTTTTQNVTQNVSVSTGQSFDGQAGLTDFTTHETDAGQLQTINVTSQAYLSYAPDTSRTNGVDVTEIGTSSTDSNGVAFQSIAASGNGTELKLPYTPGAQWMNTAARTDTETDPSGQTIGTTYAADGSYSEQITYPEGKDATVQVYPDGSGVYQMPLFGATYVPSALTVNAPSGGQIQIAIEVNGGLPEAQAFTVPVWYPQSPPVLASDTFVDEGASTLPSSCKVGSAYQSVNAEEIVETKTRLDPVFGELETDQTTQYTSTSYGLLCEAVNDDLKAYYDYSGQAGAVFAFTPSGSPVDETTVTETLALQSASDSTSAAHRSMTQSMAQVLLPRPSLARVRMILAAAHAQHLTRHSK